MNATRSGQNVHKVISGVTAVVTASSSTSSGG